MYAWITEHMEVFDPHLGMPFTRPMGDGLFEIRARDQEGIGSALFYITGGHSIMILRVFIKKSQKTLRRDLELARRRLREVRHDNP
jgi:phage-related protein